MRRKIKETKEAIIYARVSGGGQLYGTGLQRQIETCYEYARRHGYIVVGVFSEQRGSKEKYHARLQAEKMARYRKCIIICESPDRWTRKGNDVYTKKLVTFVGFEVLDIWEKAVFKKAKKLKPTLDSDMLPDIYKRCKKIGVQ